MRDQVADIERGIRIRERREELHLTQPAVVQLLEEAAYRLPESHDLHPARAGKAPVTLRGYQSYEQGGGIVWEKAKLLAQILQLEVQSMMSGEPQTPDPFTAPSSEDVLASALTDFCAAIRTQNDLLARQSAILDRIEQRLATEQAAQFDAEDARQHLLEDAGAASRMLVDAAQRLEAARGTQAK